MKKVTPFLMFDNNAEEAMKYYVSIFKNAKIIDNGKFQIDGQEFLVFNRGSYFKFSEGISLLSFLQGAKKASADGSRTSSVYHGRLYLQY